MFFTKLIYDRDQIDIIYFLT